MSHSFATINPCTGESIQGYSYFSVDQVEDILSQCLRSEKSLQRLSLSERQNILSQVASQLSKNKETLARQLSLEMGKPQAEALAEIEKSALAFQFYETELPRLSQRRQVKAHYLENEIRYSPLGTLLAIMPWNFPIWQLSRVLAPAIALGNPVLVKPAEATMGTTLLVQNLIQEVQPDVLRALVVSHAHVADVIADRRVRAVTLTGSAQAGRVVAELAGRHLKKAVLELGGSDAALVAEDADLLRAAQACVLSRTINNGQSCIAAKRFVIHEKVFPEFLTLFEKLIRQRKVGNPLLEQPDLGPLVSLRQKEHLLTQCRNLEGIGAELVFNLSDQVRSDHAFFPARGYLLQDHLRWQEEELELFGPVAQFFIYATDEEAISIANHSPFGLGASLFTQKQERIEKWTQDLEVGLIAVNDFVKSDPRMPFGGVKSSGYGRELSEAGWVEFSNVKAIGRS